MGNPARQIIKFPLHRCWIEGSIRSHSAVTDLDGYLLYLCCPHTSHSVLSVLRLTIIVCWGCAQIILVSVNSAPKVQDKRCLGNKNTK